ncbi:MAG: M20 family metallopeptidase [Chloroflexi bacterium]|nr:M20 family metallopeptidase [Chloroflexota bacterium]
MSEQLNLEDVAGYLEENLPAYLADLETIVNIDSGTFDKEGVDRVGAELRERYRGLDAAIEVHPSVTHGDNVSVELEGDGRGTVLLIGHLDTVYAAGTTLTRPFTVRDSRAYGPGVADMKSGDLSILYALRCLRALGFSAFRRILVVHNSDEEIGSPGSRELIRRAAGAADAVLVLEAGRENGNIVSARKGIADCRLHVTGRSAHAGVNHELGRSAILELAHLVVGLEGLNGQVRGATLNVGRVDAGERINVVPDQAFAHFEIRAFQTESLERMLRLAQEVVDRRTIPDTAATLQVSIEHYPMHKSRESQRLVDLAQRLSRQIGFEVRDVATGGASDGNTAAAAGRPVLDGLGPIGGRAHSPDEFLEIASIVPRTALLTGLIAAIGDGAW